ncbi:hypothetical protein FH000_14875 [Listeria monocytogenes]|nr:hypothetical protein [Listeria monocytogenes]
MGILLHFTTGIHIYQSQNELRLAIKNYVYYYNHYRIKEKLNWKCSVEFRVFNQKTA